MPRGRPDRPSRRRTALASCAGSNAAGESEAQMLSAVGEPIDPDQDIDCWLGFSLDETVFVRFDDDPACEGRCAWCKGPIVDVPPRAGWSSLLSRCHTPPTVALPAERRGLYATLHRRLLRGVVPEFAHLARTPGWPVFFYLCSRRCALWLRAFDRADALVAVRAAVGDVRQTDATGRSRLVRTKRAGARSVRKLLVSLERFRNVLLDDDDDDAHPLDGEFQSLLFEDVWHCTWCGDRIEPATAEIVLTGPLAGGEIARRRPFAAIVRVADSVARAWIAADEEHPFIEPEPFIVVCGVACRDDLEHTLTAGRTRTAH
jgi:hypothetical protein